MEVGLCTWPLQASETAVILKLFIGALASLGFCAFCFQQLINVKCKANFEVWFWQWHLCCIISIGAEDGCKCGLVLKRLILKQSWDWELKSYFWGAQGDFFLASPSLNSTYPFHSTPVLSLQQPLKASRLTLQICHPAREERHRTSSTIVCVWSTFFNMEIPKVLNPPPPKFTGFGSPVLSVWCWVALSNPQSFFGSSRHQGWHILCHNTDGRDLVLWPSHSCPIANGFSSLMYCCCFC